MSDRQLQELVQQALDWEPDIDVTHVGVAVDKGVVTLSGHVASYAEKLAAERAVARIRGVRGLAEELVVRLPTAKKRDDDQIADRARRILEWDTIVPDESITIKVEHGRVTLGGTVESYHQKLAAERCVQRLSGVTGVLNLIVTQPPVLPASIRERIETAFRRDAALDSQSVVIRADGGRVVLEGRVGSWREREAAQDAALATAGVSEVENRIVVD